MSLIRVIALLGFLTTNFAGCATIRGEDTAIGHSFVMAGTGFLSGGYDKPPVVDESNFQPSGGSMAQETQSGIPIESSLVLDFRLYVSPAFYVGMESHYLSLFLNGMSACDWRNCMVLRQTMVNWWDPVIAEEVVLKRGPSIGWIFGYEFGRPSSRSQIEYSIAIRKFEMNVHTMGGINCRGCQNSSGVLFSTSLGSGLAIRNSLRVGTEMLSGIGWFEMMSDRVMIGLGIQISAGRVEDATNRKK